MRQVKIILLIPVYTCSWNFRYHLWNDYRYDYSLMITAGAETIDYFIRRRAKYVLPKLPIIKLLFKQPKQFKPNKK